MTYPINLSPATELPTSTLISDDVQTPGGSPDSASVQLSVGSNLLPVAAAFEVQSTKGAWLFPRMTTTQITGLNSIGGGTVNGMVVYDNTIDGFKFKQAGSFITNFSTPTTTIDNSIVKWSSNGSIKATDVVIDNSNNITGANSLGLGTAHLTNGQVLFKSASNTNTVTLEAGATVSNVSFTIDLNNGIDALGYYPITTNGNGTISPDLNMSLGNPGVSRGSIVFKNSTNNNTLTLRSGVTTANTTTFLPSQDAGDNVELIRYYNASLGVEPETGIMEFYAPLIASGQTKSFVNTDVVAWYSIPATLVPAPGAGFAIIVKRMMVNMNSSTVAYTSGGAMYAQYGTTGHSANAATDSVAPGFIRGNAVQSITVDGVQATTLTKSVIENQPITITNATANFATGDGTIRITIWYSIIPVT